MMQEIEHTGPEYLSCADTAKLMRGALKREFPGVKFSVRSSTYSGGASINVGWIDGPTAHQVEQVTSAYSGADFDGMIDMKSYNASWLEEDGTAHLAHAPGTGGSKGSIPESIGSPRTPGARLVHFGADFVFTDRRYSDAFTARREAAAEQIRTSSGTVCEMCRLLVDPEAAFFARCRSHGSSMGVNRFACSRECAALMSRHYVAAPVKVNA